MLSLKVPNNLDLLVVDETTPPGQERVPLILRGGTFVRRRFMGFMTLEEARASQWAYPVKILVHHYSICLGTIPRWQVVPHGFAVQGALEHHGVYAVVEHGAPRFVESTWALHATPPTQAK